jgi:hypothetical protein
MINVGDDINTNEPCWNSQFNSTLTGNLTLGYISLYETLYFSLKGGTLAHNEYIDIIDASNGNLLFRTGRSGSPNTDVNFNTNFMLNTVTHTGKLAYIVCRDENTTNWLAVSSFYSGWDYHLI